MKLRYLHAQFPATEARVIACQMPLPERLNLEQIVELHAFIDLALAAGARGFFTQTEVIQ